MKTVFLVSLACAASAFGQSATITTGQPWQSFSIPRTANAFAVHVRVVASSNTDGGIAVSQGFQSTFAEFPVTVRAHDGQIQALGSDGYPNNGYTYKSGSPVEIILIGSVVQHQFSAWAATEGQPYVRIASENPFRQGAVHAYLDTLMVWADAGTITIDEVSMPCTGSGMASAVSSSQSWQSLALPLSPADFALHLRAKFSSAANAGIALTEGSVETSDYDHLAATVRAIDGQIEARGATAYPNTGYPFKASAPVDLIITGNAIQGRYSVWISQPGQPYFEIAANNGFRSTSHATYIDTLMVWADVGSISTNLISGSCTPPGYDELVLSDSPVAFWNVNAKDRTEFDLTGNGNRGQYPAGIPVLATMPNGDAAADFDGATEYLQIGNNRSFSIATTGALTWEGWFRPDTLQFPSETPDGYVDPIGKCDDYHARCEWEGRMYSLENTADRPDRISGYVFNPTAPANEQNIGSGAFWQPVPNVIRAGAWLHVVVEYTTEPQPGACSSSEYPGSISIWVNGIPWDAADHGPTGCMYQEAVTPKPTASVLRIGTMAKDTYFAGAIGKVAIYPYLLSREQITAHYKVMTGTSPSGSCADTTKQPGCVSNY